MSLNSAVPCALPVNYELLHRHKGGRHTYSVDVFTISLYCALQLEIFVLKMVEINNFTVNKVSLCRNTILVTHLLKIPSLKQNS